VHNHKKSIINQREVGVDTRNWHNALKNTLRQAPDVILIGEIRDRETMEHAIAFAETGHLCISTLHANNANQALDRIINFFPEERKAQLLMDLSLNLQAFVSQRLVPTVDGKRCAAIEVLLGTPRVADLILRGNIDAIKEVMEKSENSGMKTFDSALFELYMEGLISEDEALRNADSPNNVRLKIKFAQEEGDDTNSVGEPLSVAGTDDEMVLPDEDGDDDELVLEPASPLNAELVLEDSLPPGESTTQRPAPPPPVFETSPAYGAARPQQGVTEASDDASGAKGGRGEYGGLSIEMDDDPGRLF
jgi:twitching motility protein PilU